MRKLAWSCLLLAWISTAQAEALFILKTEHMTVILYSEPCQLSEVTNLKRRATWTDKTGTHEGCWGVIPQIGLIPLYFADKTVTAIPAQFFEKASGA
jgi:hypothetical protein